MKDEVVSIESLIKGGLIGAVLGAFLLNEENIQLGVYINADEIEKTLREKLN